MSTKKLHVLKLTNKRHVTEMVRVAKIMYQHYIGLNLFLSLQSPTLDSYWEKMCEMRTKCDVL